ncbi:MAG: EAL domain-containing protein [Pseudomonadota bacterium]
MPRSHNPVDLQHLSNVSAASSATTPLREQSAIWQVASTAMDAGLIVLNMRGRVLWANPAYCRMLGHDLNAIIGCNPFSFAVPEDLRPSQDVIDAFQYKKPATGKSSIATLRNVRNNGEKFWIELKTTFDILPQVGDVAVIVARDVTAQVAQQKALQDRTSALHALAHLDSLTGLANRRGIMDALQTAMSSMAPQDRQLGLMNIDVDHFKAINETYGQAAGDALLRHVATRLQQDLQIGDIAARVGGDEFLVLCQNVATEADFASFGNTLIEKAKSSVVIGGSKISADLSIGAAISTRGTIEAEEFLKRANFALFDAKQRGRGKVTIYDSALHARKQNEDLLTTELRQALDLGQMTFAFQPTFDAKQKKVLGLETLVRWQNPRLGPISPAEFLPIARNAGLLGQLDKAALVAALKLKRSLVAAGLPGIRVGFNGSAEFLSQDNFIDMFLETLALHDAETSDIVVEVLETVVFHDVTEHNPLARVVKDLRDAGSMVLLDDFGTGYAGLTHLASLAISGVKIDRSLTKNILTDSNSAKVIAMMVELCRDLDLYVVTEGIETQDQADALLRLGGVVIQGYLIAKPMTAEETVAWLRVHHTDPD